MKVMTILGTRPEIIRLSVIIEKLDRYADHTLVHTGQNFEYGLSELFLKELKVRKPDYFMGVSGASFGEQIGMILIETEKVVNQIRPDALLILGDTNSGLSAIIAKRIGIPVFHMEAGNRCYDDRVPEEVNRRIIDHSSSILMPYTERSKENLVSEGIRRESIFVIGNPIYEVLCRFEDKIDSSNVLGRLGLEKQKYFLVTFHRAENVDNKERLQKLVSGFERLVEEYRFPIIASLHPRTKDKMETFGLSEDRQGIMFLPPLGFFDFVKLEKHAYLVLSDSGTVQEECAILKVPNVSLRDVTERPETLEHGSNMLTGAEQEDILKAVEVSLKEGCIWTVPPEYIAEDVSSRVVKILLGYKLKKWFH